MLVFFSKLMDCALGVLKTSFFIKEKYFFSAFFASLSLLFFAYSIRQDTWQGYLAMFIATFIGNYVPPKVLKKFERDSIYKYEIITSSDEAGKILKEELKDFDIPIATTPQDDGGMLCHVFSDNKKTSYIIEDKIKDKSLFSFNIIEIKSK